MVNLTTIQRMYWRNCATEDDYSDAEEELEANLRHAKSKNITQTKEAKRKKKGKS